MKAINITAYTDDASKIEAIKAFMKALKIKFDLFKEASPYNSDFVKKINQGDKDLEGGKGRSVTLEELNRSWK